METSDAPALPSISSKKRRLEGDGDKSVKVPKLSARDREVSKAVKKMKELSVVSVLTHLFYAMLICIKSKEVFRCGGRPPGDLIFPKNRLMAMAENPYGFVIAVALCPDYRFTVEEIAKLESMVKVDESWEVSRVVKGPMLTWTCEEGGKKNPMWSSGNGRPIEGVTPAPSYTPYIMGGCGSFWPIPLQREGACATLMWKATLPEEVTASWLDTLGAALSAELKGRFWTLSKRYD